MKSPERPTYPHATGLAVFILAIAAYLPISQVDLSMLDEGALLYVAERLTKGDVLYRDIVTGIMPGVYYLQALFFSVLGYSVMAGRVLACATLALNALLVYLLATRFLSKKTSIALGLFFISTALPSYWMAGYSQVSLTFVLTGLLFFLRYLGSRGLVDLLISGAAAGMALVFKQNYGVFITAGLGMTLMARLVLKREWRPVLVFSAAFLTPLIVMVLYFYSTGALPNMTEYTFFSLFKKAAGAYYKPYPLLSRTDPLFFNHELYNFIPFRNLAIWSLKEGYAREAWVRAAVVIIYALAPLIIASSLVYGAIALVRRRLKWEEGVLMLVSFLLFLGVFPRSDIHHLIFIAPPLMVTGAMLAGRLPVGGKALMISRTCALVIMGLFSALCLVSSYMPLLHPAPGREKVALDIPRAGGIRVEKREARVIRAVTNHIRKHTRPDEPILVVPTGAMYYFLAGRRSVVPYPLIMPGAMDEAVVIKAMEKASLRYIIYSDMSFDEETLSRHMPLIHDYIQKNYSIDPSYPLRETGGNVYVLKRGRPGEEITPLDSEAGEALVHTRGRHLPVLLDLAGGLEKARSGVILGSGRGVPLFRENQVTRNAWLLKDAILQEPGRGWSKVYTAFSLHVPRSSGLRFSIGQSPVVWSPWFGDGALFEVFLYDKSEGRLVRLFSRYLDPKNNLKERRWFTYLAGLKKYGGRDLIIYFVTSGGPRLNLTLGEMNRWRQIDMAGWGAPAIVGIGKVEGSNGAMVSGKAQKVLLPPMAAREMARFDDISFILEEKKKYPGDYDVLLTLGRIYERAGRKDKAIREYRAALKSYARGSEARNLLSRYYIRKGQHKKAEGLLIEGLGLDRTDAKLNMTMADLYRRRGKYEMAVMSYGQVLRARPGDEWALLGLARTYLAEKKPGKAMSEANKALDAHPGSTAALIMIGDAYRLKKEWKRAEKTYRKALRTNPDSPALKLKLALSLKAMGRTEEALKAYGEALTARGASDALKKMAKKEISSILRQKKEQR